MAPGRRVRHLLERHTAEGGFAAWLPKGEGLKRRAARDDQVGVDVGKRLATKVLRDHSLQKRYPGRAADEDDVVELCRSKARRFHRVFTDVEAARHERLAHVLELLTRQRVVQVQRSAAIAVSELFDAKLHLRPFGELDLRPLRGRLQPLVGLAILARVVAALLEELSRHVVGDGRIDVVAAEKRVARGREDLEHVAGQLQDRDVEGTATEVVHGHTLIRRLVVTVREGRGSRLVEDAKHFETGDSAGGFGRASLKLVEVGGNGDDGLAAFGAKRALRDLADVAQHERADLAEGVGLAARRHQYAAARPLGELEREPLFGFVDLVARVGAADQPLDRVDGVLRVEESSLLGGGAHQYVAARMKGDDRGDECAVLVFQNSGAVLVGDRDHGIGRAEVDPNDGSLTHVPLPPRKDSAKCPSKDNTSLPGLHISGADGPNSQRVRGVRWVRRPRPRPRAPRRPPARLRGAGSPGRPGCSGRSRGSRRPGCG